MRALSVILTMGALRPEEGPRTAARKRRRFRFLKIAQRSFSTALGCKQLPQSVILTERASRAAGDGFWPPTVAHAAVRPLTSRSALRHRALYLRLSARSLRLARARRARRCLKHPAALSTSLIGWSSTPAPGQPGIQWSGARDLSLHMITPPKFAWGAASSHVWMKLDGLGLLRGDIVILLRLGHAFSINERSCRRRPESRGSLDVPSRVEEPGPHPAE